MNESLTTESLSIAAVALTRYEGANAVKSSGQGHGSPLIKMMTRKSLSFSRRIAAARPPCAKGTNRQNGLSQKMANTDDAINPRDGVQPNL